MERPELNRLFESLGRIEANQTAMRTELLGPGGRIIKIEETQAAECKLVEKHERIYVFGRWAGVPLLAVLHIGLKSALQKMGWQ